MSKEQGKLVVKVLGGLGAAVLTILAAVWAAGIASGEQRTRLAQAEQRIIELKGESAKADDCLRSELLSALAEIRADLKTNAQDHATIKQSLGEIEGRLKAFTAQKSITMAGNKP